MLQRPLAQLLSGKVWRSAVPPVPKSGGRSAQGADLTAVSCPSKLRCTAVGDLDPATRNGVEKRVLLDVLSPRGWRAGSVEPPSGPGHFVSLDALSCLRERSCVGVGIHAPIGGARPVVARIRGRDGSTVLVPPAPEASTPTGYLFDVVCGAAACVGVGYDEAQGDQAKGLIVEVTGGAVESSLFARPSDAQEGSLKAVALQSSTTAVAVGYDGTQGLLVTGISAD